METILRSRSKEVIVSIDRPFVMIGERINPTGRKVLAAEMRAGVMDRVKADAIAQVEAGAQMLDVNAGVPMVDEPALLVASIKAVSEVTDVPICIDSSVIEALEAALAAYEGKALVNSVTAEGERMDRILPVVKKYGAAVIGMSNDETGITMVPQERVEIARRIIERAAYYGIPPEDVIIDPIAMTVAADPQAGLVTLETMRLIKEQLGNNMTCGASNVSFGLPDRSVLNAAFFPVAMHAGLTCAITNPLVPDVRKAVLASDLLLGHDEYAMRWISVFRQDQKKAAAVESATRA
ncbi:MAG TPA: dihydropteroate synthase [Candidatus Dormibacteraeota bacterium]|jgi:5-methyltetrahydrofolate--homocysteine methyltransferase|nr:dihydropteroate synthase [Candidatus Dormibacteraeota bacterium]